jgi:hypothetical protein
VVLSTPATGSDDGIVTVLPTPSPTPTAIQVPPADTLQTIGAVIAILLALAAAIIGYRIIRGGRGL